MQYDCKMNEPKALLTLPAEPITKKSLASFMGVSERTVYNYTFMASQFVDDFLGDYPAIDGRYVTSLPLTSYQAWVLTQIHEFLEFFASSKLLTNRLENDRKIQASFSKQAFMAKFPEYSEPGSIVRLQP
jgi:hypothetical protein